MNLDKQTLRSEFSKNWKKHYDISVLKNKGFSRMKCSSCGKYFWSMEEREKCADPSCIGYKFIGNPITSKKLGYLEAWNEIKSYFVENGHTAIKPYPTVARWRDDLYFTIASINDFQPYVVNGELDPIANPLIVPQTCIRFSDVSNVGVSGRHYTSFVMVGQHAFNTEKTGLFYWKDEALGHDMNFLERLGIPLNKVVFIEDVWAGGGNFGPCIEYFSEGLELGNCVFMQYELSDSGPRELKTKVIDMGAGLERFSWFSHGSPTSYEITFSGVIEWMKEQTGVSVSEKDYLNYARLSGRLNADEFNLEEEKKKIASKVGQDLVLAIEPLHALYAIADHLLTTMFACTDGMLPSNSGGGYNIRMILRRVFGFEDEFGFSMDLSGIIERHAKVRKNIYEPLGDSCQSVCEIISEERKKYENTRKKAKGKLLRFVKKGNISSSDLEVLYKSDGIPPEAVVEEAKKFGIDIRIPQNFYKNIQEKEKEITQKNSSIDDKLPDVSSFDKTKTLFYTRQSKFTAHIISVIDDFVILDRTAFYPEGGGQVSDIGKIGSANVLSVKKKSGVILHKVDDPSSLSPGSEVECIVDIERRIRITRHHTSAHLLNAAAYTVLGRHVWQAGAEKSESKAHMDLTHYKKITREELSKIEDLVNKWIMENRDIFVEVLPRNVAEDRYGFRIYQGGAVPGKELRIINIKGVDVEACGGTHHMLERTGEIGFFKIIGRESVQDGRERIIYKCGESAVEHTRKMEQLISDISSELKCDLWSSLPAVKKLIEDWKRRGKALEKATQELSSVLAKHISDGQLIEFPKWDKETAKRVAEGISRTGKAVCILFSKNNIICMSPKSNPKSAKELLNSILRDRGGVGGGSDTFASGRLNS